MWVETRENQGAYEIILHMTELPVEIGLIVESAWAAPSPDKRWVCQSPDSIGPMGSFEDMVYAIVEYRMGGEIANKMLPITIPEEMQ